MTEKIERILGLLKQGKIDEALDAAGNDAPLLSQLGIAFGESGNHEVATRIFERVISINPNDAEAWYNKGVALGNLGKDEEAVQCYEAALKINPNLAEAWYNKGVALGKLGKYEEEVECYEAALKINPNYDKAWYNKGVALGKLGKHEEEVECYEAALKINPNDAEAWYNKGVALGELGKHEEAVECSEAALKINPNLAKAWSNKGVALGNLGKYEEAVECYEAALKINPNLAEAYANKGVTRLNTRQYNEALPDLNKAENLLLQQGRKTDADKVHSYDLLAQNAVELMARIAPLDDQFMACLSSGTLAELRDKASQVAVEMEAIVEDFKNKEVTKDARALLEAKAVCFSSLSQALNLETVDLNRLQEARQVFEKWNLGNLVIAVNSLDSFIRSLRKHDNLEGIGKNDERFLLILVNVSSILDGTLTEAMAERIKGEPFVAKPVAAGEDKEPKIICKHVADREKDWVRFCLVQLHFRLDASAPDKEFAVFLKKGDKEKARKKIFAAVETAKKESADIIIFPELSFDKEWLPGVKEQCGEMIVIGGSYYEHSYNVCPILINGEYIDPPYKKIQPSPLEMPDREGRGMKSGKLLYIFGTRCGTFSVLNCWDYSYKSYPVLNNGQSIDFVINVCCDPNMPRSQPRCNSDCQDYRIDVIRVNKAPDPGDYGGSCIIGRELDVFRKRLVLQQSKPEEGEKYELCEMDGEMILIADLNIGIEPPVVADKDYGGRFFERRRYKYSRGCWSPLN